MARGVPLTPDQSAAVLKAWQATANASEAARVAGVSEHAARNVIERAREADRGELHARALARVERDYRRALTKNLPRLTKALVNAPTTKDLVEASKAMHDGLRTLSQVRTAHAKVTGDHAPDKHELTGANGAPLAVVMLPPLADEPSTAHDPLAAEPRASD